MRIIKQIYSVRNYKECKLSFRKFVDRSLAKEILSFSGWNLFGSIAAISVTQVRSILLNIFFGVQLNAADGIAKQVTSQVNTVSSSMTRALNPQLVKSEGGGDRKRMLMLTELSTKFSILLFALFAIPVIIEMPYLLSLWLKNVPDFAVIFSRLILIGLLLDKFSFEITAAVRAVGDIRGLSITESIILILNVPVSYILFKQQYPPYVIFLVAIFFTIIILFQRLYYGKTIASLNIISFVKTTMLPIGFSILPAAALSFILHYYMSDSLLRLGGVFLVFIIVFLGLFKSFCLNRSEYDRIKQILISIYVRVKRMKK